ncbi:MAG: hypothetical protein EXR75_06250 [Myxococcales bacterium]|nr:hypothetical protein [Myxococcales bacterium]
MTTRLPRRSLLALAAVTVARQAGASDATHEIRDLTLPGDRVIGRRMTLLVPRHTTAPVPLLVVLHGLGETHDERLGARAWIDRYGLLSSYLRLLEAPVARLDAKANHWDDERLRELNTQLRERPFAGLAVACPYTPNVYRATDRKALLDAYADWLTTEVVPRARRETSVLPAARHTGLDGCSLGGYAALEVLLRKPGEFGAWGSVQAAFGAHRIASYAERLREIQARHGTHLHIESSRGDPFRAVNEALSRELTRLGVKHALEVPPGPHDQPFLRDSGTALMLAWHDRALR